MTDKELARRIVCGYLNTSSLDFYEKVAELAAVNSDNERLLQHINVIIDILTKAKEDIEKEINNGESNK